MRFFLLRIYYFLLGVKTLKYYKTFFSKNLTLSREEMVSLQNRLIRNLIDHAYNHTRYYRELMDSLDLKPDDICCKEDLKKLPVLSKSTVRLNLDKIKSDDRYGKKLTMITSSGSTGNEAVIFKSPHFNQMGYASFRRFFSMVGWDLGDRSVWFWRNPYRTGSVLGRFCLGLELFMQNRKVFDCLHYNPDDFKKFAKEIKKFKPKAIFARAGILEYFSEYLIENNIKLESVKVVISCAEALQKRDVVENAFNQPVYSLYSSLECFAMAMETEKGIMRVADDNAVLNIYDSEFIITPLHSYGFPLINYQIGDTGAGLSDADHQDDYPFSKIDLKIGRTAEAFITRDRNIIVMGVLMAKLSENRLNTKAQQFVQTDYDKFIVNYVPGKNFHKDYRQIVSRCLTEYFGDDIEIQFNKLDTILLGKNGKRLLSKRSFALGQSIDIPKTA